jgi:hypothetical protein
MNTLITKPNIGAIQEKIQTINPDLVNTITNAEKNLDSQFFILHILEDPDNMRLISISTDKETFKFNFTNIDVEDSETLTKYKLFNPFPIPKPDEIEFELHKTDSNDFWVKTISEVGMARIEYMEKLTPMGIFDSFSL